MAELETRELGPWCLLPNASYMLFYEGGCFSGVHSVVPCGSGGGDTVSERRVSRAPLICLNGGLSTAACDHL